MEIQPEYLNRFLFLTKNFTLNIHTISEQADRKDSFKADNVFCKYFKLDIRPISTDGST
jgi:hypothetical protein